MPLNRAQFWTATLGAALAGMLAIEAGIAQESSQPPPAADAASLTGPGWTGVTNPLDVIAARAALMSEIEQLMIPLDSFTAGDTYDLDMLRQNAEGVSKLLKVVPHLFPPTTNLYNADDEIPVTLAQADVWENFDVFTSLAAEAVKVADEASKTSDPEAFRQKALDIRTACAACHDSFLLTYEAPALSDEDENFDFGGFN